MTGLYPIIRRARRPLLIKDDDAAPAQPPRVAVPPIAPEAKVDYTQPLPQKEKARDGATSSSKKR